LAREQIGKVDARRREVRLARKRRAQQRLRLSASAESYQHGGPVQLAVHAVEIQRLRGAVLLEPAVEILPAPFAQ
jgi:hypothetical protein